MPLKHSDYKFYLGLIVLAIFVYVMTGCNTPKRIQKKADKATRYLIINNKLAEVCATYYPSKDSTIVRDSVSFDTLYVEGEDVYLRDTLFIEGKPVFVTKKCPKNTVVTKTIYKDSLIIRRDFSYETVLNNKIRSLENELTVMVNENERYKKGRNWWRIACLITWGVLVAFFAGRLLIKR